MAKCFYCGAQLGWSSDSMRSDFDDVDESDDYLIQSWSCRQCGVEYEVYFPSENRRKELEEESKQK